MSFNTAVFCVYQYKQPSIPTPLVAAYKNHSRKPPAPVMDIFIASRGCIPNTAVLYQYKQPSIPTPLVATYENHSRKPPAPVMDIFITSRGCPLTRALTVVCCFAHFASYDIKGRQVAPGNGASCP